MDFSSLSAQVDEHVITSHGMYRAKTKVLGRGSIAGLKALVKVLIIQKPKVLTGKVSSIKLCERISSF